MCDEEKVGHIVPRMTEAHWSSLAHVARYGLAPESDAYGDLKSWGLVEEYDNSGVVMTTDLGDLVLDEEPSLDGG
jgi:hypothetical protein